MEFNGIKFPVILENCEFNPDSISEALAKAGLSRLTEASWRGKLHFMYGGGKVFISRSPVFLAAHKYRRKGCHGHQACKNQTPHGSTSL